MCGSQDGFRNGKKRGEQWQRVAYAQEVGQRRGRELAVVVLLKLAVPTMNVPRRMGQGGGGGWQCGNGREGQAIPAQYALEVGKLERLGAQLDGLAQLLPRLATNADGGIGVEWSKR